MTTSSSCGLQACVPGPPRDSEGSLSLRLSHGPLFSPLAFARACYPDAERLCDAGCQGLSDQAHRESKPLIITFNGSSQRELRRRSFFGSTRSLFPKPPFFSLSKLRKD